MDQLHHTQSRKQVAVGAGQVPVLFILQTPGEREVMFYTTGKS